MSIQSKQCFSQSAVWLAMLAMMVQPVLVQGAAMDFSAGENSIRVTDVELEHGGVLRGQVVGSSGQPQAKVSIRLQSGQQSLEVKTDAEGRFAVAGLVGSTYQLQVGEHVQLVRAWAAKTAPPHATAGMLIVPDDSAVLGQHCGSPVCGSGVCGGGRGYGGRSRVAQQRLILGGLIAAAIAIPIAVENGDDDDVNAEP